MKTIFIFSTYLEFVSPGDGKTVIRLPQSELNNCKEAGDTVVYSFTYDDLSPEQKAILPESGDPIAQRLLTNLPARTTEELRALMVVTPAQIRLALLQAGISPASVTAAIELIADDTTRETASILWEYATQFERNHPFVSQIGAVLGKTDEEIDAIFAVAKTLN